MHKSREEAIPGHFLDRLFRGIVPGLGKYLCFEAEGFEIQRVIRTPSARLSNITHPTSLCRKQFIPARQGEV
jgi:hypothetical protein